MAAPCATKRRMDQPEPSPRGRFITLEGGEGAGKSTQARMLAEALRAGGRDVLLTREPGGAPGAEILRGLLLSGDVAWSLPAETLLHFAARAEHVEKTIRPALAAGTFVVCDRFYDSTMVYQGHALGGDRAAIASLAAMLGLAPDLTLVLDVDVPTAVARMRARGTAADRYERLGQDFFARVREGFLAVAAAEPGRCVVIDATLAPEAVAARVWDAVEQAPLRR
jgi:dTMP kinase